MSQIFASEINFTAKVAVYGLTKFVGRRFSWRIYAPNATSCSCTLIQELVWQNLERYPTIDFSLVVMSRALMLLDNAPLMLCAVGCTAGWIVHAIEQYGTRRLIRLRARYVGERRVTSDEWIPTIVAASTKCRGKRDAEIVWRRVDRWSSHSFCLLDNT